jgi:hypothetical protein
MVLLEVGFPGGRDHVSQTPDVIVPKRDILGWGCFVIHVAFLIFIVTGWMLRPVLIVYLVFLPLMVLQWRLNKGTCILNNLESLIRTGRWRNPANIEEGAWMKTLVYSATGLNFTVAQLDRITYSVMAVLWALALWHLSGR